jgi:hypothetical protein
VRLEETLILETLQRGIDRADRVVAVGSFKELAAHFEPIGALPQSCDGEQDGELETIGECRL